VEIPKDVIRQRGLNGERQDLRPRIRYPMTRASFPDSTASHVLLRFHDQIRYRVRRQTPAGGPVFVAPTKKPNGVDVGPSRVELLRGLVRRLVAELGRPAMKRLIIDHQYFGFSIHWYQLKYYFFPRTNDPRLHFYQSQSG
jgi:hypothetical protein